MTSFIQASLRRPLNLSDLASVPTAKANLALVKADVGLGSVDNTSDINKPVSTAQAAADALKVTLLGTETIPGTKTLSSTLTTFGPGSSGVAVRLNGAPYAALSYVDNGTLRHDFGMGAGDSSDDLNWYNYATATVDMRLRTDSVAQFRLTPTVAGDPVATRGAAESLTGSKTFTSPPLVKHTGQSAIRFQNAAGSDRYVFGRSQGTNDAQDFFLYDQISGFVFTVDSALMVNFSVGPRADSKALIRHGGAYTSGAVTFSTSAPSGGNDGDIWFQYV